MYGRQRTSHDSEALPESGRSQNTTFLEAVPLFQETHREMRWLLARAVRIPDEIPLRAGTCRPLQSRRPKACLGPLPQKPVLRKKLEILILLKFLDSSSHF